MLIPDNFSIIDPHIHQWDIINTPRVLSLPKKLLGWNQSLYESVLAIAASKADKNFVGKISHVANNYLPSNYGYDSRRLNISNVVHIEADWNDKSDFGPVKETEWVESLFSERTNPSLGGIIGHLDLRRQPHRHPY